MIYKGWDDLGCFSRELSRLALAGVTAWRCGAATGAEALKPADSDEFAWGRVAPRYGVFPGQ